VFFGYLTELWVPHIIARRSIEENGVVNRTILVCVVVGAETPPHQLVDSIHLGPAREGGEPYAGVPRGREHPLGQGRGESPAREGPVSSRAEGRGSTRLYRSRVRRTPRPA